MEKHLKYAEYLAQFLDNQFSIAGFRFGIGPLIGLIPGIGDILENALSFYLLWIGLQLKIPLHKLVQMFLHVAFNFFLGLIPLIGDVGDFFYRSNMKNLAILKDYAKDIENVIEGEIIPLKS